MSNAKEHERDRTVIGYERHATLRRHCIDWLPLIVFVFLASCLAVFALVLLTVDD